MYALNQCMMCRFIPPDACCRLTVTTIISMIMISLAHEPPLYLNQELHQGSLKMSGYRQEIAIAIMIHQYQCPI
jgi:hypothetical protein